MKSRSRSDGVIRSQSGMQPAEDRLAGAFAWVGSVRRPFSYNGLEKMESRLATILGHDSAASQIDSKMPPGAFRDEIEKRSFSCSIWDWSLPREVECPLH